jgi:hypothetical protein
MPSRARFPRSVAFVTFLASVALWAATSGTALAGGMAIDGSLPRDLAQGSFQMTVTITGVTDEEHTRGAADSTDPTEHLSKRFNVKLKDVDSSKELPVKAEDAATGNLHFYVRQFNPFTETQVETNNWTYVYYLEVVETVGGELKSKVKDGKLTVSAAFYLGDESKTVADKEVFLQQETYVVDDTPAFTEGTPVIGTMKSLIISWETPDSVKVSGGSADTRAATTINVYLVNPEAFPSGTLPAKKFDPEATEGDADASCDFIAPLGEGGECVTCGESVYLDATRIADLDGVEVRTVKVKDGQTTIAGLTNGKRYQVFLQYEPDGLGVTSCLSGVPSPNFSLTELNGEGEARVVDVRCFIATAAYGTPLHGDLDLFRAFRDRTLLKLPGGQKVVDAYYQYGPAAADFVAAHPKLKAGVRAALEKVASVLKPFY